MTKLRKLLPALGHIRDLRVNTRKLLNELNGFGLLSGDFTAARSDTNNAENLFIKANLQCKRFFNENNEAGYQEVNLSKPSYVSSNLSENDAVRDVFAVYRTKRLDPRRPEYSEHADEKKHDMDAAYLTPGSELSKVFAFFKGKPCRVRIARMKAGHKIKPHVDYDPSYLFRYHIPLITNRGAVLGIERVYDSGRVPCRYHLPADGRIFWLNTGIKHWVENNSDQDRYHLLIDVTGDLERDNVKHLEFL